MGQERCQTLGGSPPRMRGKRCPRLYVRVFTGITPADAGKTSVLIEPLGCLPGSPPRMRGKHLANLSLHLGAGITPADAGKTDCCNQPLNHTQDHPRGCGENQQVGERALKLLGSPPRMRGKLFADSALRTPVRITPADAGKTAGNFVQTASATDHPRGCGENLRGSFLQRSSAGSPPRMRGKHPQLKGEWESKRITPADAGKTTSQRSYKSLI